MKLRRYPGLPTIKLKAASAAMHLPGYSSWVPVAPVVALIGLLALASPGWAQSGKPVNWDAITAEATTLLSKYIQIDTTNPPGNELAAARFLREQFLAAGIPAVVFQPAPGRGIVAARLRGAGRHRKAVILLSHMDVVAAAAADWSEPPFDGVVKGGQIWGRGALDDKGPGVVELMALLAIKRARILLDRDIIFIATGDEEAGGKMGVGWLVNHEPDLYGDAGYVLNEGGGIRDYRDGHKLYAVGVTEKSPLWLHLTVSDNPGHGAVPPRHSAVTRIVSALAKLIDYNNTAPVDVLPVVGRYFAKLAAIDQLPPAAAKLRQALRKNPDFASRFLSVPFQSALVRNTITPTVVNAGYKTNVIPATASADLDCRLLPNVSPKDFIRIVHEVIADNGVKVESTLSFPSVSSPEHSPLMEAITLLAHRMDKGAVVAPMMTSGFNDCHYFREHGLVAYGFVPIPLRADEPHGVHGANEHLAIADLRAGIQRMFVLLQILGGK